jgi:hypothetical protein
VDEGQERLEILRFCTLRQLAGERAEGDKKALVGALDTEPTDEEMTVVMRAFKEQARLDTRALAVDEAAHAEEVRARSAT